ncbi:hypothetical protein BY996DRAFT_6561419 [Phakopsora pachyrhizi]|nr:hypothetical protein BY996DRAFT_6561419 [Phakopsora pachyrhizi]
MSQDHPLTTTQFLKPNKPTSTRAKSRTDVLIDSLAEDPYWTLLIINSGLFLINNSSDSNLVDRGGAVEDQIKTGSLKILDKLVVCTANQMAKAMPDIVPALAGAIWDAKADVKKAAWASLTKAYKQERQSSISKELTKEDKLEEKSYTSNSEEPEEQESNLKKGSAKFRLF